MTPARLREILAILGVNQTTGAPLIPVSSRTMRRYCAGHTPIPPTIAEKMERLAAEKTAKPHKGKAA